MFPKWIYAAVLVIFGLSLKVSAADKTYTAEGMTVKVLGKSGKILLSGRSAIDENSTETITITMDFMKELDQSGNEVGNTGKQSEKHVFNNFAVTTFTFSNVTSTKFQNLSVHTFDFEAFLSGPNATLKVTTYIFKESGTIQVGQNETATVAAGTFKFTIEINGWTFCTVAAQNCKKGNTVQEGKFVEFGIELKTKSKPTKKASNCTGKCPEEYDLGGDSVMTVPTQALENDATWVDMATGFPKVDTQGSKFLMRFRFPKFTNKILFDPILPLLSGTTETPSTTSPSETTTSPTGVASGVQAGLVVVLASLFWAIYSN